MPARVSIVSPRLDSKPWGGDRLGRFGLKLPPGAPIGEALVTANEATITEGFGAGQTLGDVIAASPSQALGNRAARVVGGRDMFPLLAKLIDATENLSIQVHPDDAGASALDRLGKTEAWHVLAADPGSVLYLGVQPAIPMEQFRTAAERLDGSSASLMRTVRAQPGTTILIPAGTIHALGAGVMVYEIQQPSDVTFRLDDWGRVDAAGNPREVHLDAGFAVSRIEALPEIIPPISLRPAVGERHLLTACRYFSLERIALPAGGRALVGDAESPAVVTILAGSAAIDGHDLQPGQSAVVWPTGDCAELIATRPLVALLANVPDLDQLADQAARSGADAQAIAALAGGTGDLVFAS